jgi:hypothetical protein
MANVLHGDADEVVELVAFDAQLGEGRWDADGFLQLHEPVDETGGVRALDADRACQIGEAAW